MTNKDKPHGALGSNAPLERVSVEEPIAVAKEVAETPLVEEQEVVYLRDDLRPGSAG